MKIPSLEKLQEQIRRQMVDNLAAQSGNSDKKLFNALQMVNQSTMWRLVQWTHESILPKVLSSRGAESLEFKNYTEIEHAIVWAMYILQQYEQQLLHRSQDRQQLDYYRKENARLELELMKYATVETLLSNDAINMYRDTLVKKAIDLITHKPETK